MICLRSHAYQYVLQRLGKTVDNHNSFEFKIHCKGKNEICSDRGCPRDKNKQICRIQLPKKNNKKAVYSSNLCGFIWKKKK